jgi:MtN3 and saliva related transmembrane protein
MTAADIIAILATVVVVSANIPQIIKGYKTKSLEDVSMLFLIVLFSGVVLWLIYGVLINEPTFIISNSVILVSIIVLISMKIHYTKKQQIL